MDKPTREQMITQLKQLSDKDLRVLRYEMLHAPHTCTQQQRCCDTWRCNVCHVAHVREAHGQHCLDAYNKFSLAGSLTWKQLHYKEPYKSKKKEAKPRERSATRVEAVVFVPDNMSTDALAVALAAMAAELRKRGKEV